jgi:hypothetical protein
VVSLPSSSRASSAGGRKVSSSKSPSLTFSLLLPSVTPRSRLITFPFVYNLQIRSPNRRSALRTDQRDKQPVRLPKLRQGPSRPCTSDAGGIRSEPASRPSTIFVLLRGVPASRAGLRFGRQSSPFSHLIRKIRSLCTDLSKCFAL